MSVSSRRRFLSGTAAIFTAAAFLPRALLAAEKAKLSKPFEVTHSEKEWRRLLSPEQFAVLRAQDTEAPYSSVLNKEKRRGIFYCAGCNLPLFSSATKFESHTGWPSFYQPLKNAVGTSEDDSLMMTRIEVHCRRCGGHLGHVFDDGPKPTGLRYCMNGVALVFRPGAVPSAAKAS